MSPETVILPAQEVPMAGAISQEADQAAWVRRAHALGDDLSTEEWALFAELASVVKDWPARNAVARAALDNAARALQVIATDCSES